MNAPRKTDQLCSEQALFGPGGAYPGELAVGLRAEDRDERSGNASDRSGPPSPTAEAAP